ncbi:MAG: DNA polymerase III subunit gamma/tau [Patescibacteria group bacterium]|nr:DNA polymerase III subunit gamma/tau [Patescibacteria group bacterium]
MGQALYRKYRSKALSEIIGQEHITETLDKALKSGRISHAYLFTGPRGVGKTSIARILAHEINNIPYQDDRMHIDIIEIDAASNNGVEDIRDLREKVAVAPSSAKYKVYIIDEVHMLSKAAFNALLKTLEEPPAHVVFILATTDAHKLPATVISRTQRYSFKPVSQAKVVDHLRHIASAENITAEDAALELLATHGDGSFRDSISMLDQASSQGGALTLAAVQLLLGIPPSEGIQAVLQAVQAHNAPLVAQKLNGLYDQGFQAAAIAKVISQTLRTQLLAGNSALAGTQLMPLLTRLLEVAPSHDAERLLEIILLESAGTSAVPGRAAPAVTQPVQPKATATKPASQAVAPRPEPSSAAAESQPAAITPVMDVVKLAPAHKTVAPKVAPAATASVVDAELWPAVLTALKQKYNTLYGVVRMAVPTFSGKELELAFGFAFHQKRLSDPKNKKILADIIYELSGQAVHITCVVRKDTPVAAVTPVATSKPTAPSDISAINDIFGGGEII